MDKSIFNLVNYDKCIINITSSIMASYGIDIGKKTISELDNILAKVYKNIVYFICDGMGSYNISRLLNKDDLLLLNKIADVASVFPPTTVAATNSIESGLEPCEHALLGWTLYVDSIDKTLMTFGRVDVESGKIYRGRKIVKSLTVGSVFGRLKKKKVKVHWLSPFSQNAKDICSTLDDYKSRIADLSIEKGKKFIYCYYNQPDHDMHEYGAFSTQAKQCIEQISEMVNCLKEQLSDTLIIITSDHGQKDRKECMINDAIIDCCASKPSVEPTAVAFRIKPGREQEFEHLFKQHMQGYMLLSKREILESGLFGKGETSKYLDSRCGDYFAIAVGDYFYVDKLAGFIGIHAGLSAEEMTCPLIVVECDAKNKSLQ